MLKNVTDKDFSWTQNFVLMKASSSGLHAPIGLSCHSFLVQFTTYLLGITYLLTIGLQLGSAHEHNKVAVVYTTTQKCLFERAGVELEVKV